MWRRSLNWRRLRNSAIAWIVAGFLAYCTARYKIGDF